jgi:LPXTG-site transpeptidase (sortase) family protein
MITLDKPETAPPGGTGPPSGGAPPPQGEPSSEPTKKAPSWLQRPTSQVALTMVVILSSALLGFALYVGVISSLHYDRAQHVAYADFRKQLALGTAPIGQTMPKANTTDKTRLVPLGTAVAVLNIPKIHLRAVVFEGSTPAVMESGPGHVRSTPMPGQAGVSEIMGRATAYGGPFGKLSHLSPGDLFTVTTGQGLSTYRVLDVRREGDRKPPLLQPGKGRLVLATADGVPLIPAGVLRVDADLMSAVQQSPAMVLTASDMSSSEQAMGTDPSAWVPLVLWGQGLVLAAILLAWARSRWGRWQVWIVAVPVMLFFGMAVADQAVRLLPNLM